MGSDSEFRVRYQTGYPLECFARERVLSSILRRIEEVKLDNCARYSSENFSKKSVWQYTVPDSEIRFRYRVRYFGGKNLQLAQLFILLSCSIYDILTVTYLVQDINSCQLYVT